jgi:ribonuclease P protein component
VITHPNEGQGLRVAVVAGKSVGGAVQRNRAKRVMRAAIQPLLETLKTDQDLVLLAKPGLLDLKSTEVQTALSELLKKKSSKR